MARQRAARLAQPELQLFDERRRHVLADSKPLVGGLAVDRAFNRKDQVDASHRFCRQRRDERRFAGFALHLRGDVGKLEQRTSAVRPAAGMDRRRFRSRRFEQRIVACKVICMQDAAPVCQMRLGEFAFPVARVIKQRRRRRAPRKRCVIADIGPHPRDIGLVLGQARDRGVVGIKAPGAKHVPLEQHAQRPVRADDGPDIVGQCRQTERDPFLRVAIAMAVEQILHAVFLEHERCQEVAPNMPRGVT